MLSSSKCNFYQLIILLYKRYLLSFIIRIGTSIRKDYSLTETLLRRKHLDLAHSYQSGSSYYPSGAKNRTLRIATNTAGGVGTSRLPGASASSWQPVGEGRHGFPLLLKRRQTTATVGNTRSTRVASTSAVFRTFPFGIHPQIFGSRKTTSQRRWVHFHTAGKWLALLALTSVIVY